VCEIEDITIKNQRFGVENELTGITRMAAASAVAAYFGTAATHTGGMYDECRVKDNEGKVWSFKYDGSIRAERRPQKGGLKEAAGDTYRVELVSPILTYPNVILLSKCCNPLIRDIETR
jgi:hypothetical protein